MMLVVNERFCCTCLATFEIDRGFMFKVKTSNYCTLLPVETTDSWTCNFIHIVTVKIQQYIEHNRCFADLARSLFAVLLLFKIETVTKDFRLKIDFVSFYLTLSHFCSYFYCIRSFAFNSCRYHNFI